VEAEYREDQRLGVVIEPGVLKTSSRSSWSTIFLGWLSVCFFRSGGVVNYTLDTDEDFSSVNVGLSRHTTSDD